MARSMEQVLYEWSGLTSVGITELIRASRGMLAALGVALVMMSTLCFEPQRVGRSLLAGSLLGGYVFLLGVLFPLWYDASYNWG